MLYCYNKCRSIIVDPRHRRYVVGSRKSAARAARARASCGYLPGFHDLVYNLRTSSACRRRKDRVDQDANRIYCGPRSSRARAGAVSAAPGGILEKVFDPPNSGCYVRHKYCSFGDLTPRHYGKYRRCRCFREVLNVLRIRENWLKILKPDGPLLV
ncbi:hypothetical protein EVAR_53779_1 [Eumeta japonica]|uniref:Uncharacterized protein n=1 Tax=Eumeta variegata TaxID=151549 RepID=A0A4C1Z0R5_EUMVA|nr:hypothetical protein EVAR_53779_1 [Eumeta japonica]